MIGSNGTWHGACQGSPPVRPQILCDGFGSLCFSSLVACSSYWRHRYERKSGGPSKLRVNRTAGLQKTAQSTLARIRILNRFGREDISRGLVLRFAGGLNEPSLDTARRTRLHADSMIRGV